MKITTKVCYGVNAAVELACRSGKGGAPVSLKSIAAARSIPEPYLEQLMNQLRRAGLVESVRGAQGGYRLSRSPEEITVGDVMIALEGNVAPLACLLEDVKQCPTGGCAGRPVWEKIYSSILNVVNSITLRELADDFVCACSGDGEQA